MLPGLREGCGKRVAILYGPGRLLCRHCRDLTYRSRRMGVLDRAQRRAEKVGSRLPPLRIGPKRMHHRTFLKLTFRNGNEAFVTK
jgi:hypothetical protein